MNEQYSTGFGRAIAIVDSHPAEMAVVAILLLALVLAWWALFRAVRAHDGSDGSAWMLVVMCSTFGFGMMLLAFCYAMGFSVALSMFVVLMVSLVLMSPVAAWRRRYRRRGDDARTKA